MTLKRAVLELDADFGSDGGERTGVFVFYGDVDIREEVRTGFVVGGRGSTVNSVIQSNAVDRGNAGRKGVYLDLGGGQHVVDVTFKGWEGAQDADGNPLQWGETDDPGVTDRFSATGANAITQKNVFMNWLRIDTYDSRSPATLHYGEFTDGSHGEDGLFEPLNVAIESPNMTVSAQTSETIDGSVTFSEILDVGGVIDGEAKEPY